KAVSTAKETDMKTRLYTTAAGLLLLAGIGAATAQDIVIAPEQETVIREYVVRQQVAPVELPPDIEITVGSTVPETVELYPVEAPDLGTEYRYIVVDGQTVLVRPETREIVHIIR